MLPGYYIIFMSIIETNFQHSMYHFAWADQRERQGYKSDGYKSDLSLKGGIQIICTLENDATLYIGTTKPLLIVGLNLSLVLSL